MSRSHPRPRDEEPEPDPTRRSPYSLKGTPAPMAVAAGITLVEGLLTFGFGIAEFASIDSGRLVMGLTTALFFLAFGAGLMLCAWGLNMLRPWARGPVLLAQLICLGLAWNFRSGSTLPVAIGLAVLSVLVLAGLLHPHSVEALEEESERD